MDKWIYILSAIGLLLIAGCVNHNELAERYKLELQYHERAIQLAELGMENEAYKACNETLILRNDCFISLVQHAMIGNITLDKTWCDEIVPSNKVLMTEKAYELVYQEIDDRLRGDIREKMHPSKMRIENIQRIKNDCEQYQGKKAE